MAIDVGSIEATLEVDRDPFQAGLDAAQSSAEEFVAEPYTATITADITEAEEKIAQLRAEIESLNSSVLIGGGSGPLAGTEGLEDLGADAAEADAVAAAFENLGLQAEGASGGIEGLSATTEAQVAAFGELATAVTPAAAALAGLGDEAEAAALPLADISFGAAAAGVDLETLVDRLEAAGLGLVDLDSMSGMVGIGLRDFTAGIAAASEELQGSDLAGFLKATGEDAVDYSLYLGNAGIATTQFTEDVAPAASVVERLGNWLPQATIGLQSSATAAEAFSQGMTEGAAASQLAQVGFREMEDAGNDAAAILEGMGIAADEAGDDLRELTVAALDVSDTLAALDSGGGGGLAGAAKALSSFGSDASGLTQILLGFAPVFTGIATEGVGAFMALAGAATIGLAGIGVGVLAIIPDLGSLEDAVKVAYEGWQAMTNAAGEAMGDVNELGTVVSDVLNSITPLVQPAIQAFGEVEQSIEAVAQSSDLRQFVAWLGTAFDQTAGTFMNTMEGFAAALGNMLEGAWPFIEQIEDGMVSLAQDLDRFSTSNGFKEFISWLQQNGPAVGQLLSNLFGTVEGLWEGFDDLSGVLLPVADGLSKFADAIGHIPGLDDVVVGVVTLYLGLSAITSVAGAVVTGVGKISDAFKGLAVSEGLADALDPGAWIVALAVAAGVAGYEIADHFDGIKTAGEDVANWFSGPFASYFENAWDGVVSGAKQLLDDLEQWATDVVNDVTAPFRDLVDEMEKLGTDIIEGLWDGLKDAWNDVFGWLEDIAKDIEGIFKDVLGIFSPSTVMFAIGDNVMAGLGGGLQTGWETHVSGVLESSAASVAAAFAGAGTGGTLTGTTGGVLAATALATTPTTGNSTAPITINSSPSIVINGADLSNAPALQAVITKAIKQSHAELVTKIAAGSRGHS